MSATTGIEWTDSTWNPLRGCSRVSEGRRNCYAEKIAYRFSGAGQPYAGLAVVKNGHASWTGKVEFVEKHLLDPMKWGRIGVGEVRDHSGKLRGYEAFRARRIFANSMSDLFHENVPDEWLDRIFAVMALCHWHVFQVLTKRPERMRSYLSSDALPARLVRAADGIAKSLGGRAMVQATQIDDGMTGVTLPNVWLGVSVEHQDAADERIPLLLKTPAAVRFISAEPLLGPVSLEELPSASGIGRYLDALSNAGVDAGALIPSKLDWVICGGESGPGARPMHPDWARSLRDQCAAAGVPFFFKQWGQWAPTANPAIAKERGVPLEDCMSYFPKKHDAGAQLDGREWKQFPEARP